MADRSNISDRPNILGNVGLDQLNAASRLSPEERAFFNGVFHQCHASVLHFLRRMRLDADQANDVCQDVFMRVLRQNEPEKLSKYPRAYLFRTAVNLLRDRLRKERTTTRNWQATIDHEQNLRLVTTPEAQAQQGQALDALKAAILEMPPVRRRVLVLNRIHNMTCRQIAEEESLPLRTVERHLAEALDFCRMRLGDYL